MQQLPQNIQIEQALLGAIAFDNEIIKNIILQEDDFYDFKNKITFKIFKTLNNYGKPIDIVFFKDFIETKKIDLDIMYFTEVIDNCTNSGLWQSYETEILELSKRRKLIETSRELEKGGFNRNQDLQQVYNLIDNIKTGEVIKEKKGNTIVELANSFGDFLDNYKKQGGLGRPGPYTLLDKYIGGIIPGKVYTIVAYSGVGKSNFSYSYMVDALKKGQKVIVFSLEVQKEMLFNMILKSYYGINQKQIVRDDFYYDISDFENLVVYDNIYKLEEIQNITKVEKPDIVFIDFIQNIQTEGSSEYEKMTNVAQGLQRTAISTNTTIFSISQANNESRFKESGKIQPKGSGAIFASSDIILALSRNGTNLQLNLLKNKYGMSDKNFILIPDFSRCQFKITKEIDDLQEDETDFTI